MRDLVIVGGGPAGLALALEATACGLDCVVLDRGRPPLDKPCGEGLMPDGLARLRALGVELPPDVGRPFRGVRYLDETGHRPIEVDGRFPTVDGVALEGLGLRRIALHEALVERARAVGVDVRWGHKALGIERLDGQGDQGAAVRIESDGETSMIYGRVLVGADGLRSKVREWAGLATAEPPPAARRYGVRRHLAVAPSSDRVEVHWADGCEAYVTPVADDEIGVAILWSDAWAPPGTSAGFDAILTRFPHLAARLDGAEHRSSDRGCGPLLQRATAVTHGPVALLGDASGYVDAITGEGLTLAFHQAHALARCLAPPKTPPKPGRNPSATGLVDDPPSALRRYAREHARLGRVPWGLTHLLLALERHPPLRRVALAALAAEPRAFERFLAVHVGARGSGVRSAWHLAGALPRLARGLTVASASTLSRSRASAPGVPQVPPAAP